MYGNPNPYTNPYYPPLSNTINPFQTVLNPVVQAPQMEIQKVNGEESAKAFPIGPNSSVILLDTVNPLVWVITTDASGYKTVSPFTITPYVPEQPVSASDLDTKMTEINSRLEKLEERMNKYGQSNHGASWKNKSGNAGAGTDARNGQSVQGSSGSNPANVTE